MQKTDLSWGDVEKLAVGVADRIHLENKGLNLHAATPVIYGVPRGGIHAALHVSRYLPRVTLTENPHFATVIVDDIVDTGATREKYRVICPVTPFHALVEKKKGEGWYTFPWERMMAEQGPEDNIRRILKFIGEDPDREGLRETPARVVKSWKELYSGYDTKPKDIIKVFEDGACDEMVVLKNIPFSSNCEHHMLPFSGHASLAYIPDGKVIGVSKLARLVEVFSRRLQIQERMGQQITELLMTELKPKGAGCILSATHLCMTIRGIQKPGSVMVTSSLRGNFLEADVKSEFFRVCGL